MKTYTEGLKVAGVKYRVYDFGRSCRPISAKGFEELELGMREFEDAFAGCAWLIVVNDLPTEFGHNFDPMRLPIDHEGHLQRNAALQHALSNASRMFASHRGHERPYDWKPLWGEAFMAQAHFRRDAKLGFSPAFEVALAGMRTDAIRRTVSSEFIWDTDLGIPALGLSEVILASEKAGQAREALSRALDSAGAVVLDSILRFMAHSKLSEDIVIQLGELARKRLSGSGADIGIACGMLEAIAGSSCTDAMHTVVEGVFDSKFGTHPEVLTRMVRYHRTFMGSCFEFDLDRVLAPAAVNADGMDAFEPYVADMFRVTKLMARLLSFDFGSFSPLVKYRLRAMAPRAFRRVVHQNDHYANAPA